MLATAGLPINQPKPGAKQENSKTLLGVKKKSVVFDDRTHSLFPPGVPYQARETIKFVYNWDKTKGKERHVRDPVKKPKARPLDDMYLGAMKPTTSDSAWEHLDVEKQRYSLGDYNEFIKPTKRIPKPRPQPTVADTQTDNEVILPTESLPIIPPNPVQKRLPSPQVTKRRRVPRPPWRDPSEVFCNCKQEFPVSKETFGEYWTIEGRETDCCLPLSLLDPCEVPMRSTRPDPCRVKSRNPDKHLQQIKPKMNPEDPSNENPVKNRSKSRNLEPPSVPEITQTGSAEDFSETIEPEHLNPPLRRPTQEPEPPSKPKPVAKPKPRPQCPTPCDDPCCPCPCAVPSYICCPPTPKMYYDVPGCEQTGQVTRGSCDQNRRVSFKETTIMIPDAPLRFDPIPSNPVQKRPPPPQVTKRRRAPRPPWRDPSEVFCNQEFPVSNETFGEYWTIDGKETHCCLPLSLLDPCEVPLRPDPCRVKSTTPDKDYFHSLCQKIDIDPENPCCAHPCFTAVPGRIPRLLSWAPCTPIPRTLLLCQHCGAAFCGKYNHKEGRYMALEDFCGYAVVDKDGIISFNLSNPDNEHLPEPTKSPKRVKCSCQRCRSRMSQRRVDQCPDCKCSFCKQRLVKCLNQNYYAWLDKKNNSNTESDPDVNELQDELTEPSEAAKPVKDCKLPECLCRDQKPGEPLKNCECRVSKDQKVVHGLHSKFRKRFSARTTNPSWV